MKEAITKKIREHVERILAKEVLDYEDYLVLTSYLSKLEAGDTADLLKALLSVSIS